MFKKAEIEIYDLQLDDIIVTSPPLWGGDTVFPGDGFTEGEE